MARIYQGHIEDAYRHEQTVNKIAYRVTRRGATRRVCT